jgi:hypothetical protein
MALDRPRSKTAQIQRYKGIERINRKFLQKIKKKKKKNGELNP